MHAYLSACSLAALGALVPVAEAAETAAPVLTKPPELTHFVEATLPESATGATGSVVLAITIRADGTVEDVTVSESNGPDLDAAAVAAARQFLFSPAEIDGKAARIRILYRYDFVVKVEAPTSGIFAGVVLDRDAHAPLPGVTVTLADGQRATTDETGHFLFPSVPPGPQTVTLEGERLTALSTEETFTAGERLEASYEVFLNEPGESGDDLEILVSAPTIKRAAVSTQVGAEEARKVPGTEGDVLRVVESLPGVARASLGTGALVVWGAAPEDTGVYVDGVPVPRLYHDGGLRSVMGSDFVKSVELVPGGYGATYGRNLGGLVSVTTPEFDEDRHGAVSADLYDASGALHGPLAGRWNAGLGGRYGYVGPLLGRFYPDIEDSFPVPHYADGQARVGLKLGPNETLDLTGLVSKDLTESTAPNPDPAREASQRKTLNFQRVYLRYAHDLGDGNAVTALVYGGADQSASVETFGSVETSLSSSVHLGGARASYRTRLASWATLEGGLDALISASEVERDGSVASPAREGDVRVFGQPPPDQISQDSFSVVDLNLAPYTEADLSLLGDHLHLVPGFRLDPFARSVSRAYPQEGSSPSHGLFERDPSGEPRLAVQATPSDKTHLTAAWGRYHQQPAAADLSASFGNPTLPAASGTQTVLGGGVRPVETLSIEATGFYTTTEDLAMRNPDEQPARAEALVATGSGRSYGVQALIRLDPTHGLSGWLSYTLAWSERREDADADWRPSDYDQRHVLTGLASYSLPHGFEVGARARVATGFPRTEVTGAYYDNRRDLYQPRFGDPNGIRLPTFFQVDIRAAETLKLGETTLEISLEVQNATNQTNVEEYLYSADYTERGAIAGLPILPVLGLRWSF